MGTSCGQGVSKEHRMMRFFLSVVLAGAALADSEPYTIGQVAHGYGHGIITGVDYGHGLVSGYGAIGNRGYYGGYAGYGGIHHGFYGKREADSDSDAYATGHPHNVGVITGVGYSGYGGYAGYGGYHHGFYGKREADSDAYTIGQVAYGLPVANAYATGHPHNVGVITGVGYSGYGGYAGYGGYHHGFYGKREADSD